MKFKYLMVVLASAALVWTACKKDDNDSSSSTTTTSTTSTTGNKPSPNGPNTLVYVGEVIPGVIGNCEFSASGLGITGSVASANGTSYTLYVNFVDPEPPTGTYKTVALEADLVGSTECYMGLMRITGAQSLSMVAPANVEVKLVKDGNKYKASFKDVDFRAILGGNGTRKVSCTGFGCE